MDQTIPVDGGMATTRSYQNLPQRRRPICKAQRGDVYWTYMNLSGTRQMGRRDRVRLGLYSLISDLLVCKPLTPAR